MVHAVSHYGPETNSTEDAAAAEQGMEFGVCSSVSSSVFFI